MSYSIDDVFREAQRKGFTTAELTDVAGVYHKARSRFEERSPRADPGYSGALRYVDRCNRLCWAAAILYIDRTIDKWQGDGQ